MTNALPSVDVYSAIGRMAISWAIIELSLDCLISMIHHNIGGKDVEPDLPWALQRKLKYIRKCFKKLDRLAPFKDDIDNLMADIAIASEDRHNIIHGVATKSPEGQTELQMIRLLRGGTHYVEHRFNVTLLGIMKNANKANALAGRVLLIGKTLEESLSDKEEN